jgi:hypothetical protein
MDRFFQVRYNVGDKSVAHEHYTHKGAKMDAKQISKVLGNVLLGEIEVAENGPLKLVKLWEYVGGEAGKPSVQDREPAPIEVLKSVEDTKLPEEKVQAISKRARRTNEEIIAAKKAEYEAGLAAINAGTFVVRTPGRKAVGEPKIKQSKIDKMMEALNCSEATAQILSKIGVTSLSKNAKVAALVMDYDEPVLASQIASHFGLETKEVVTMTQHINGLLLREDQPWQIKIERQTGDARLRLVGARIEYTDEQTEQHSVAA